MITGRAVSAVVVAAAAMGLLVFAAIPLLVLLARALGLEGGGVDLSGVAAAATQAASIRNSVVISAGAALVATLFAVPLAFLVERTDARFARALAALAVLPLAVPPYLLGMASLSLLGPRSGLLGGPLQTLGVVVPLESAGGIAVVVGVALSPLVFLRLQASLSRMDGSLEEAARTAGAGPVRVLWSVTLPLVLPSVASGQALVFVGAAAAFGVPALLGMSADPPVPVVTTRIYTLLQVATPEATRAALGLSLVLGAIATAAFAIPALLLSRLGKSAALISGKAARPSKFQLGRLRTPISVVALAVALVVVVLPLMALVLRALLLRQGAPLGLDNLGTRHLITVLLRDAVPAAAATSAWLAVGAGLLVTLGGAALALAKRGTLHRGALRFYGLLGRLAETSYALPGTLVAVALILTFATELRFIAFERVTLVVALAGSVAILLVAYATKSAAIGLRAADEAFAQLHPSLEEAARTAGAKPLQVLWTITLPLVRGHLSAAFLAIALPLLTELTMSVLLVPPGRATLGTVLFELNDYGDPQEAAALATWMVLLVLGGHAVAARLARPTVKGSSHV